MIEVIAFVMLVAFGIVLTAWLERKRERKRHATRGDQPGLYGRSRFEWFQMRDCETQNYLRKMPLREYARLKSLEAR